MKCELVNLLLTVLYKNIHCLTNSSTNFILLLATNIKNVITKLRKFA